MRGSESSEWGLRRKAAWSGFGVVGWESSSGGVGDVRLRPKGRRGMGRRRGGPSSDMMLVCDALGDVQAERARGELA